MNSDLHQRAGEVFSRVRRAPPEQRASILNEQCDGDESLRREVESLLAHAEDRVFLETPALGSEAGAALLTEAPEAVPRIAGFTILGVLGQGGMGVVYRARQERPARTVALKMMRHTLASEASRRRFEREAELLARLHHPGIAQVFETGADECGRPFIAMELVEGEPLNSHVRWTKPTLSDRVDLLVQACDAVQHAHQRGVIHRDLKAANVLVESADSGTSTEPSGHASGRVKILDFGVGRLVDDDLNATMRTEAGQLVGTLRSMSPEQLDADPSLVDARSDVYALGVLAYETLSDKHPFADVQGGLAEVSLAIRERDPPLVGRLNRSLRGDLEIVVAHAMEKDPARRYQSAGEFAADLRRCLADQPILARPASTIYRIRKLARRNTLAFVAICLLLTAISAGVVATVWQAVRATTAERLALTRLDTATEQSRIAEAVNQFLQRILATADPRNTRDPDITVREALDTAAADVGEQFRDEPMVEAAIRRVIGDTYRSLGLPADALPHLERAVSLLREHAPETHPIRLSAVGDLAILYKSLNRLADAAPLFEEDLRTRRIVNGVEAEETLVAEVNLARLHDALGKRGLAEQELRDALAHLRDAFGDDNINTIVTRQHLAGLYIDQARHDEARPLLQDAIDSWRRIEQPEHPYALIAMGNMAMLESRAGDQDAAIRTRSQISEIQARTLGPNHPETLIGRAVLADFLHLAGRYDEALPIFDEVIPALSERLGGDHPNVIAIQETLARTLFEAGKTDQAETQLAEIVERRRRANAPGDVRLAIALQWHARALRALSRDADAEPLLREALSIIEASRGTTHADTLAAAQVLAALLTDLGRDDEAAELASQYPASPNAE
ncbi:MAG: serine/threonine protein kinase [Phycisphaeraceae bacterium]|nr:serine/threonine protein kinase [Phycisphaeraceae bacterium]